MQSKFLRIGHAWQRTTEKIQKSMAKPRCSFLTWFGHDFSAGQFLFVLSLPYRDNDVIFWIFPVVLCHAFHAGNSSINSHSHPSERKNILRSFLRIPMPVALLASSGYNAICDGLQWSCNGWKQRRTRYPRMPLGWFIYTWQAWNFFQHFTV